jgi:hypothetical protein
MSDYENITGSLGYELVKDARPKITKAGQEGSKSNLSGSLLLIAVIIIVVLIGSRRSV